MQLDGAVVDVLEAFFNEALLVLDLREKPVLARGDFAQALFVFLMPAAFFFLAPLFHARVLVVERETCRRQ